MPGWMKLTAYDRAKVLKKTADLMRERADAIARTLTMEQGKPLAEAKAEVLHSADTFEWFAEEGKRAYGQVIPNSRPGKRHVTLKHPVGVVGAISPWNFPITLQARKIAPALAAGCTIVCKPASQTPLCLVQVFECLIDAGLPAGRRQPGHRARPRRSPTSSWRTRSVRKISFTGSTEVGKQLMQRRRRPGEAAQPGTGRPRAVHRLPRRRPGGRGQDRGHGQVPQQRPGVHRPEPVLRPQGRAEEVHRGGRRVRQGS